MKISLSLLCFLFCFSSSFSDGLSAQTSIEATDFPHTGLTSFGLDSLDWESWNEGCPRMQVASITNVLGNSCYCFSDQTWSSDFGSMTLINVDGDGTSMNLFWVNYNEEYEIIDYQIFAQRGGDGDFSIQSSGRFDTDSTYIKTEEIYDGYGQPPHHYVTRTVYLLKPNGEIMELSKKKSPLPDPEEP